eukprot:342809-Rhodomonas_salina.1
MSIQTPFGMSDALYLQSGSDDYLLAANYWDGASSLVNSMLYRLNFVTAQFEPQQQIPTQAASGLTKCTVPGKTLVAVANFIGNVELWEFTASAQLMVHDSVMVGGDPVTGAASVECADVAGMTMMSVARFYDADSFSHETDSYVLKWTGTQFAVVQTFQTAACRSMSFFQLAGDTYMMVANEYSPTSTLYRWNGA